MDSSDAKVLSAEVARIKREATAQSRRFMNWVFWPATCLAIVVGVTAWIVSSITGWEHGGKFALALGFAIFFVPCAIGGYFAQIRPCKCPQCGMAWAAQGDNVDWMNWKRCPGCGLAMDADEKTDA